jgi:hypothetical protein
MCAILKYLSVLISGVFLHILQICAQPKFINSAPTCGLSLTVHSCLPDPICVLTSEPTTIISGNGDVRYATRRSVSVAIWTVISLQHAGSTDVIRIMLQGTANHLRSDMHTQALCHPKTPVLYFNLWKTQRNILGLLGLMLEGNNCFGLSYLLGI